MNADEVVRNTVAGLRVMSESGDWSVDRQTCTDAAALIESLTAALAASQRRERAAVEDMKVMALAMRESEELSEGCCFACICDGQNLPANAILPYGECPGFNCDDCFEWRGPAEEGAEPK